MFASHDRVNHSLEEYSRRDPKTGRHAATNRAEGFFGITKCSLDGTHDHVSKKYLSLYFAEFDYKYKTRKETDGERTPPEFRAWSASA